MADKTLYDKAGDLAHQAYDYVSGKLGMSTSPDTASSEQDASHHIRSGNSDESYEGKGGKQWNRSIDKQISDNE